MRIKSILICATILLSKALFAQDIQVQVLKEQIASDTIAATFGAEQTDKDPFGRRVFAQWLLQQLDAKDIVLDAPALFLFSFKVDEKGNIKKLKTVIQQQKKLANAIEKCIKNSPPWNPYVSNGKPQETEESFGIVLQPAKSAGETLRPGYHIPPQYPKGGFEGFISQIDTRLKEPDFRYEVKEFLKTDIQVQLILLVDNNGSVKLNCNEETPISLTEKIRKRITKLDKWLPGLYLTKPAAYTFSMPYTLAAWNEEQEGEQITENAKTQTYVDKEIARRAQEKDRQSDAAAMRSGGGGGSGGAGGGGGGGGGRVR